MRFGNIVLLLALVAALMVSPTLRAEAPVYPAGFGIWVWSPSFIATEAARQKLVRFSQKHGISHLDVHVSFSGEGSRRLQNAAALRELVLLAGRHNITTAALLGDPRMFRLENHARALGDLNAIVAFSRSLPAGSLFNGIKYDVEPYLTKEWKAGGASRMTLMQDFLDYLRKAGTVLREQAPQLWLAADTPFWWDKPEFTLAFNGAAKRFSQHIQDLTDFIVIMSYRRNAKDVLNITRDEAGYARRIGKVVFLALETNPLKQDAQISFWDQPRDALRRIADELLGHSIQDPGIGGLMFHSYRGLVDKLDETGSQLAQEQGERAVSGIP